MTADTVRVTAEQTHREVLGTDVLGSRCLVRYDVFAEGIERLQEQVHRVGTMHEETVEMFDDRLFGRWGLEVSLGTRTGSVFAEGFISNGDEVHTVPVLGGSGDFAGARGTMTLAFTGKGRIDVALAFDRLVG